MVDYDDELLDDDSEAMDFSAPVTTIRKDCPETWIWFSLSNRSVPSTY